MRIGRKGLRVTAVVLLIGGYLVLQRLASLPKAPIIAPEPARARAPFPVDFALPDLQGQTVRLSDQRGKVVLINFWATWCYPCRSEMPSMNALYQDYRDKGFEILAISSDVQGKDVVAPFVEEYRLTFPVLLDPRDIVGTRLGVQGIPTSYLLDKNGRIAGKEIGAKNWNSPVMRRRLAQLLAEEVGTPAILASPSPPTAVITPADYTNPELVAQGQSIYARHCASCHGANLEGQPNWKRRLPSGAYPAPPHDASGHTWHHPDQLLFTLIKEGRQTAVPRRVPRTMPAFGVVLTDPEIWAVLAYIKSRWPADIRAQQAQISLNQR
jgi:peroxiredoxin